MPLAVNVTIELCNNDDLMDKTVQGTNVTDECILPIEDFKTMKEILLSMQGRYFSNCIVPH